MKYHKDKCSGCGKMVLPKYNRLLDKWFWRCDSCCLLALAAMFEEGSPDDTLKDISDNEQMGAWLRDAAKGNVDGVF